MIEEVKKYQKGAATMLNDNDSSWVAQRMIESINVIEAEKLRPTMLYKPRVYQDGSMWCALLGNSLQEGVVGFGKSPELATREFDRTWYGATK